MHNLSGSKFKGCTHIVDLPGVVSIRCLCLWSSDGQLEGGTIIKPVCSNLPNTFIARLCCLENNPSFSRRRAELKKLPQDRRGGWVNCPFTPPSWVWPQWIPEQNLPSLPRQTYQSMTVSCYSFVGDYSIKIIQLLITPKSEYYYFVTTFFNM